MLRLCQLTLDPCQLGRHTHYQPRPSLCQLMLSLSQFVLSLDQRKRMLERLDGVPLADRVLAEGETPMLDRGSVRDRRQLRRLVFGRPLKKDVGDGDQRHAGEEEEAAVESGEPQAGGAAGQSQPRAGVSRGRAMPITALRCGSPPSRRSRSRAARRAWLADRLMVILTAPVNGSAFSSHTRSSSSSAETTRPWAASSSSSTPNSFGVSSRSRPALRAALGRVEHDVAVLQHRRDARLRAARQRRSAPPAPGSRTAWAGSRRHRARVRR